MHSSSTSRYILVSLPWSQPSLVIFNIHNFTLLANRGEAGIIKGNLAVICQVSFGWGSKCRTAKQT